MQQRNKLNEDQNSKLVAQKQLLNERKDEMAKMDKRIAELQERLRKKQQQQSQENSQAVNRSRPIGVNVAAVEPYVQQANKPDNTATTDANFPMGKQDPKYQTLPYSIKFPSVADSKRPGDTNIYDYERSSAIPEKIMIERNNNNKPDPSREQLPEGHRNGPESLDKAQGSGERPRHPPSYQSLMGLQATGTRLPSTTASVSTKSGTSVTASTSVSAAGDSDTTMTGGAGTSLSYRPSFSVPGRSTVSIMSNFAPRPYGSSYGPSPSSSVPSSVSSTPNSSLLSTSTVADGFPKTSTPVNQGPEEEKYEREQGGLPDSVRKSGPPSGVQSDANLPPTYPWPSHSRLDNGLASSSHRTSPSPSGPPPPGSVEPVGGSPQHSPSAGSSGSETERGAALDPAVSSALSVLSGGGTTTSSTTKPSYRYASKSVIANTYMRKLGPDALDQYRKNMNQIYQTFPQGQGESGTTAALGQSRHPPGSPTATVRPFNIQTNGSEQKRSPPRDTVDSSKPLSSYGPNHLSNGPTAAHSRGEHPSFNIDPIKFRPNAPRPLRRRVSSGGDSPQSSGSQAWGRPAPATKDSDTDDDVFRSTNQNSSISRVQPDVIRVPPVQQSSSQTVTPQENNLETRVPSPLKSHNGSDQQPASMPRHGMPVAMRRKKTNLKSKDSVKNSRRVSFDPLALLLDASLEGELDLVMRTAKEVNTGSKYRQSNI